MSEPPGQGPALPSSALESSSPVSPVRFIPGDVPDAPPQPGMALCLSGGGYRAMLFHAGALRRLNELAILSKVVRISSVSGGSITAGALAMNWRRLKFNGRGVAENFDAEVERPIRELAGRTIDVRAVLRGAALLGLRGSQTAHYYDRYLFKGVSLQDLPDSPVFIFNSTNTQTAVLWRFSKKYMADYRVGLISRPDVKLAVAVAASSAFPPFLSPQIVDLTRFKFDPPGRGVDLNFAAYTTEARLTDGGVYDNLGLETAWKKYQTVLVSDACAVSAPQPHTHLDWARQTYRTLMMIDSQVGALRKRNLIASFLSPTGIPMHRTGTYWGIGSDIANYKAPRLLDCPLAATTKLAAYPTRLAKVAVPDINRLMNWGYAIADAAMRTWVLPSTAAPDGFPYSGGVR